MPFGEEVKHKVITIILRATDRERSINERLNDNILIPHSNSSIITYSLYKPHSDRRSHPTATKSKRTQGMSTPILNLDDEKEKVEAAIFFLRCQEWMIRKYIKEIRIMYLNPLDELCSGKKRRAESVSKSMECSSNSSAHGTNKIDSSGDGRTLNVDKVSEKLQQALKALQREDEEMGRSYQPVTREKTVSLADCCALYRLKTILEAMQELLDIQANLDKWFENNKTNMNIYIRKGLLKNLLINALTNFEMAYIITEIFAIQQVPRQEIRKIKPEYSKYIRPDSDTRNITIINKLSNKRVIMRDYIKKLEGQISQFRTVVHEIAKNLEIIIQTIIGDVRDHHLEVNVKQLNNSHNDGTNSKLLTEESQKFRLRSLQSYTGSKKIRNFGIVAHVNHGKSTLADRLLELTGVVDKVERERGITVKAQSCTMFHKDFMLNLIDTPGHADFRFEVSRSLAVTNGILLVVAANQGVEAQTVANFWLAFEAGLTIIPIINKIDLNNANISRVLSQMENLFDFSPSEILRISAKNGTGVDSILSAIVERLPPPKVELHLPFRAHIFDSWYETHRGPVMCVAVHDGRISQGQKIRTYHSDCEYEVLAVGIMNPDMHEIQCLYAGQVGYLLTTMKSVQDVTVGETLYDANSERIMVQPMSLFTPSAPCIYANFYPTDMSEYNSLHVALNKLALNDSSVQMQHDSSAALGSGFKIGFSGLLHMEVFCARLKEEYNINVIMTAPSVEYNGQRVIRLLDASDFPIYPSDIDHFLEPVIKLTLLLSSAYCKHVEKLCVDARGEQVENNELDAECTMQQWRLPFAEMLENRVFIYFSGYVTYNYQWDGFQPVKVELLMIHINDLPIYEFSEIMPSNQVKARAKEIVRKLKEEIPRQQYEVQIKATLGQTKRALVQTVIAPIKKDFVGRRWLGTFLQKAVAAEKGKERMKQMGQVRIPKEAFINVLRR
ncbi:Elongation factor 4 [Dirofilaria immitis]|nr:Elongation factor 4 [Dirofilaria immitis]